jgi:hypothetical protein
MDHKIAYSPPSRLFVLLRAHRLLRPPICGQQPASAKANLQRNIRYRSACLITKLVAVGSLDPAVIVHATASFHSTIQLAVMVQAMKTLSFVSLLG